MGANATGLSAVTISRLKQDCQEWSRRDLSKKHYVYVWADGVYSNVWMDNRLCLLVIIGSDETGRKELPDQGQGFYVGFL